MANFMIADDNDQMLLIIFYYKRVDKRKIVNKKQW